MNNADEKTDLDKLPTLERVLFTVLIIFLTSLCGWIVLYTLGSIHKALP